MVKIDVLEDPSRDEVKASQKLENAIDKARNRKWQPQGDPTLYRDEHGHTYRTTDRIMTTVELPEKRIPSDSEVFDGEGIPDYAFIKEHFRRQGRLSEEHVLKIIDAAADILYHEQNILHVGCPAVVVGDIHGQFYDMIKMLSLLPDPSSTNFIFLGDYVDRGDNSIEVLVLLYTMKINFPQSVFLLRGNHESFRMTDYFTFKKECERKYSGKVYKAALDSFKELPLSAVLNDQFFCVHAGISPKLGDTDDVKDINRRKHDFPSSGLFCDLEWSDPNPEYDSRKGGHEPLWKPDTERNTSYYYSYKAVSNFLDHNNLLSVIRGHQPQDAGYRMYKTSKTTGFPTVITIFSAPNYCHTYGNKAAALIYDGKTFNIKQFVSAPSPYYLPDFKNVFQWSVPFVCEKIVDVLQCILNVCTETELEETTKVTRDVADKVTGKKEAAASKKEKVGLDSKSQAAYWGAARLSSKIAIPPPGAAVASAASNAVADDRRVMASKLQAIGRTARMYNVLREESESMAPLRDATSGRLPRGILLNGREELRRHLKGFADARKVDINNEGMPPSKEEEERLRKEQRKRYRKYIAEGSSSVKEDDVIL